MQRLVIANWKMQLSCAEQCALARSLARQNKSARDVYLAPTFTALQAVGKLVAKSGLKLAAQDMFWQAQGAYTGEESPRVLREVGCQAVIIGHSERREHIGETDDMVARKAAAALDHGLMPIVCIGETSVQRQQGQTAHIIHRQLESIGRSLDIVGDEQLVIAYEPVWAIGRGQASGVAEVATALDIIGQTLHDHFPLTIVRNNIRIIYGGSVTAADVTALLRVPALAGFLVGGASLQPKSFQEIVALTFDA